jgi:hypothetical protein
MTIVLEGKKKIHEELQGTTRVQQKTMHNHVSKVMVMMTKVWCLLLLLFPLFSFLINKILGAKFLDIKIL